MPPSLMSDLGNYGSYGFQCEQLDIPPGGVPFWVSDIRSKNSVKSKEALPSWQAMGQVWWLLNVVHQLKLSPSVWKESFVKRVFESSLQVYKTSQNSWTICFTMLRLVSNHKTLSEPTSVPRCSLSSSASIVKILAMTHPQISTPKNQRFSPNFES